MSKSLATITYSPPFATSVQSIDSTISYTSTTGRVQSVNLAYANGGPVVSVAEIDPLGNDLSHDSTVIPSGTASAFATALTTFQAAAFTFAQALATSKQGTGQTITLTQTGVTELATFVVSPAIVLTTKTLQGTTSTTTSNGRVTNLRVAFINGGPVVFVTAVDTNGIDCSQTSAVLPVANTTAVASALTTFLSAGGAILSALIVAKWTGTTTATVGAG
jgi:hypothetical protein